MMWPRKIPKEPDFYTHSKWKKGNGICHAEQQDLPEIILHGKTIVVYEPLRLQGNSLQHEYLESV